MKFRDIRTGIINDVTNKDLIPQYEKNKNYEKVKEEAKNVIKKDKKKTN